MQKINIDGEEVEVQAITALKWELSFLTEPISEGELHQRFERVKGSSKAVNVRWNAKKKRYDGMKNKNKWVSLKTLVKLNINNRQGSKEYKAKQRRNNPHKEKVDYKRNRDKNKSYYCYLLLIPRSWIADRTEQQVWEALRNETVSF